MTEEKNQTYVKIIKNLDSRKAKSGEDYYEATYTDDTKDRFWRDHMVVVNDAKERGLPVKVGRAKKDGYWNVTSVEVSSLSKEEGISESKDDRRDSIERQVSAKIAFEFDLNEDDETAWSVRKALLNAEAIFQWIHNGALPPLSNTSKSTQEGQGAQEKEKGVESVGEERKGIKTLGDLFTACATIKTKTFPKGVARFYAMEKIWAIKEEDLPRLNLDDAWQKVLDHVKGG